MANTDRSGLTALVKEKAAELGFDIVGIARPRPLSKYGEILRDWCNAGMNDGMDYLSSGIEKRSDPGILVPGIKSLIVAGLSYFTAKQQKIGGVPEISRYAYGTDYHELIRNRLNELLEIIKMHVPDAKGKAFSDTAPLLEKKWAVEAGLGWQGKHSVVINRQIGSFFFIGILAVDIELDYDSPQQDDHCGECVNCIVNCPTGAINPDRTIDARKCISNLTIENRGPVSHEFVPMLGGRIYGCDACQEACPWNTGVAPHKHPELMIREEVASMTPDDWKSLTEERFSELFAGTPVGRVKFAKFRSNIVSAFESMKYQAGKA